MGYQVLARKYRPQRFSDVAGQDHVTRTLMNALSQNRIAHGYIFSGHRGIGKTTIARILAQALNCGHAVGSTERPTAEPCGTCDSCVEIRQGNAVDVIEIDAATNRGIDEIRELRDAARYAPSRDRFKIYILDEAHQITEAAFNALLKTLEEPPAHVIFMMATTEPENIPQTIRSRCQHFSFHAVKFEDILDQLKGIAAKEEVSAEDAALALLAEAGDGSMRDALSIMDQAIASAPVVDGKPMLEAAQIRELMGSVPNAVFERLLEAVAEGKSNELMQQLNVLLNAGHSPSSLARQMARYLRNTLMAKIGGEQTELLQISSDERARATRTSMLFSEEEITRSLQIVLRTFDELNYKQEQRFHLELGLLKLIHAQRLLPVEELLSGIVSGGGLQSSSSTSSLSRSSAPARSNAPAPAHAAPAPKPAAPLSPFAPVGGFTPTPQQSSESAPKLEARQPAPAAVISISANERAAAPAASPFAATETLGAAEALTEGALAKAPAPQEETTHATAAPQNSTSTEAMREAVSEALLKDGHTTASTLMDGARWTLDGASLKIEVAGMGKKMLALTINAAAEKIIRQELQRLGAPTRFLIVPGEGAAPAARAAKPLAGSVQETALAHPMVQKAREIFKAEVRSVVDLRGKN